MLAAAVCDLAAITAGVQSRCGPCACAVGVSVWMCVEQVLSCAERIDMTKYENFSTVSLSARFSWFVQQEIKLKKWPARGRASSSRHTNDNSRLFAVWHSTSLSLVTYYFYGFVLMQPRARARRRQLTRPWAGESSISHNMHATPPAPLTRPLPPTPPHPTPLRSHRHRNV